MKSLVERTIEMILLVCSTTTSVAILAMVFFLFKEGVSLFDQTPVDEGFVLAVNLDNPVGAITPQQTKAMFDQEVTRWSELSPDHGPASGTVSAGAGSNDSIILFRIDNIGDYFTEEQLGDTFQYVGRCIGTLVDSLPGIVAFIPAKYTGAGFPGRVLPFGTVDIGAFLSGDEWFPTAQPVAQLGVLPLILGTLWVSFGALLIALPLGLATAIYLAEIANGKVRNILKPFIELLAGIPSVVFGFFGLVVIVPMIQDIFGLPVGETALAGSIILGIMALPTIITISEDALRTTPRSMKEASLALGANKWQTIHRVVIPYAGSGITAAAILGIGRAIGETMAVLMVTGNAAVIPHTLLEPVRTIPATIAAELGEAPQGGLHFKALFALGCILFLITMVINVAVGVVSRRRKSMRQRN